MQSILDLLKKYQSYWIILVPLLILAPGMSGFPFPSGDALFSDMAISHFPNALFLRQKLLVGEFPLWSDTILSGYPFAANPLSSLWYLPHYFALLFPLPFGLNLIMILHLFFGGVGVLLYLRKQGVSEAGAVLSALTFVSMPKMFAHYGAGHVTLLYAVPWTPWLLLALESKRDQWYKQPALILALIFLADPRWAAYAGLLWLGWLFACSQLGFVRIKKFILQLGLTVLLSAPLLFPLLNYTRLSTRSNLTAADILSFSLSPVGLLGLLFPNFSAGHETIAYFGIFTLILILVVLLTPTRVKVKFWFWVVGLSLLYALGENIPGIEFVASVPGLSLLRVPTRALFLTGFSFSVLAGFGVDALLELCQDDKGKKRIRLILMALFVFSAAIAFMIILSTGEFSLEFVWGASALLVGWVLLEFLFSERIDFKRFVAIFALVAIVDLGMINQSVFAYQSREVVLAQGAEPAAWLADQPDYFRVYSPSYSIPQQTAVQYGLHLADGVDPLQFESYAMFMEEATGIPQQGYTVTIPSFIDIAEDGSIAQANQAYIPDIEKLRLLNVKYIVSEFDLPIDAPLVAEFEDTRIYQLPELNRDERGFDNFNLTLLINKSVYIGGLVFVLGVIGLILVARKESAS